ncbi:MAG: hypothetical protein ABR981_02725 [Candidatus Micrarchaeaceae archaeon]|jgi:hypothetical protein
MVQRLNRPGTSLDSKPSTFESLEEFCRTINKISGTQIVADLNRINITAVQLRQAIDSMDGQEKRKLYTVELQKLLRDCLNVK